MKYLVVGLGNIGAEYADTRHNIGFKVLDCLAEQSNIAFTTGRYGATAELRYKGRTLVLLKPSTYMNLSGKAVRYWMEAEKIAPENLLVVVDDIALPFGTLRMRPKGSAGGHNGLKNITELLGTEAYARIRFGIGGDFEQVAENAKRALMLPLGTPNPDPFYAQLEEELLEAINQTGIGVQGLGGRTTCLGLHIIAAPTHIAGLPVAVNVSCHVTRHATAVL